MTRRTSRSGACGRRGAELGPPLHQEVRRRAQVSVGNAPPPRGGIGLRHADDAVDHPWPTPPPVQTPPANGVRRGHERIVPWSRSSSIPGRPRTGTFLPASRAAWTSATVSVMWGSRRSAYAQVLLEDGVGVHRQARRSWSGAGPRRATSSFSAKILRSRRSWIRCRCASLVGVGRAMPRRVVPSFILPRRRSVRRSSSRW